MFFLAEERCHCNQTKLESELREKKLKLILREEETLYNMKKEEQLLKNEIASVQLRLLKEKRTYLTKKRKLQLQILEKQIGSKSKPETNGGMLVIALFALFFSDLNALLFIS